MTVPSELLLEFQEAGRALCDAGLVEANSGNISARCGDGIVISRHDATLRHLQASDLMEVALEGPADLDASVELPAHRAVYRMTAAQAIVHAHPPAAIAASLELDEVDFPESKSPVVEGPSASEALAEAVASALGESPIVIARGHGTFAVGGTLAVACERTLRLEETCRGKLESTR